MLAKLARIILAFATFPLVGAFGLRWVGSFVTQLLHTAGVKLPPLVALDLIGAGVGLLFGFILAVQVAGCAMQPETSPVRSSGDTILIILGLTLVLDVAAVKLGRAADWLRWLPAGNLVIWAGCAAATSSPHRMRQQWRRQREQAALMAPPAPPASPPPGSYDRQ